MATVLKTTFKLKRGTAARWAEVNPVLVQGEPGFILDENRLKIGDGITAWNDLPYVGESNVFSAPTKSEFPIPGVNWTLYKAEEERKIYQWNDKIGEYEELSFDAPIVPTHTYEVFSKPEGTIVNINDSEIRIWCAAGGFTKQQSGANADPNSYYIGLKIYAPNEEVFSFKESLGEIITDPTMYYFNDNDFAGIDEFGRKYSIVWLPVAVYDAAADTWTYYGDNSTSKKFIGWNYVVDWYNMDGLRIATNTIRINLSNENCHYINEPYYMASINVNKLIQEENNFLVLYGGSATDNI